MKKLKFAKKKILTLKKAKKNANTAFSKYIRTRDAHGNAFLICVTCNKSYPAFGVGCAQAGHFIPGRHSMILYDERNCHGQCYNCNINLKGNWVEYESFMIKEYGRKVIAELKRLDKINPHYKVQDYLDIEAKFKRNIVC